MSKWLKGYSQWDPRRRLISRHSHKLTIANLSTRATARQKCKGSIENLDQPIIEAARAELPELVEKFISLGADINTVPAGGYRRAELPNAGCLVYGSYLGIGEDKSLLDIIQDKLKAFNEFLRASSDTRKPDTPLPLDPD